MATIRTLNQIVSEFREIATQHRQINNFTVGTLDDFSTSGTTNYPAWWVQYESNGFQTRTQSFGFTFWLVDIVSKDRSNLQEVFSDMSSVAMDVIAQINDAEYGWAISQDYTLSPIYEPFNEDEVAGWTFTVTVNQPFTKDKCQIPFIESPTISRPSGGGSGNTPLLNYVPTSRTLTINGVSYDLSADRTWTISTGGSQTLAQTLALGNSTGAYDLVITDGQVIKGGSGNAKLKFNYGTNSWQASADGDVFAKGWVYIDDFEASVGYNVGGNINGLYVQAAVAQLQATNNVRQLVGGTIYTDVNTNGFGLPQESSGSLILALDSNKYVHGLATSTYPSLTELTYVKGVTSAIQTQLNAKIDTFVLKFSLNSGLTPADSTTYYFGSVFTGLITTAASKQYKLPFACTLVGYSIVASNNITTASSESSTLAIRLNNTTDLTLSSSISFGGAPPVSLQYVGTGLSTSYAANDLLEAKWTTPAWTTNPTAAALTVDLYFTRP